MTPRVRVDPDQLYDLYVRQSKPVWSIAKMLGISRRTVYDHLKRNNFSRSNPLAESDWCPTCGHIFTERS